MRLLALSVFPDIHISSWRIPRRGLSWADPECIHSSSCTVGAIFSPDGNIAREFSAEGRWEFEPF